MMVHKIGRAVYGEVPKVIVENAVLLFLSQVLWNLTDEHRVGFEPGHASKGGDLDWTGSGSRPRRED